MDVRNLAVQAWDLSTGRGTVRLRQPMRWLGTWDNGVPGRPAALVSAAFSPDGTELALVTKSVRGRGSSRLRVRSVLAGTERHVSRLSWAMPTLLWSPDVSMLAAADPWRVLLADPRAAGPVLRFPKHARGPDAARAVWLPGPEPQLLTADGTTALVWGPDAATEAK